MSKLILFEDEHLLVVNKPAGMNTHAPAPYAGEGIYDWLRHREPPWASLAIVHRLDKETSGVIVFGKTPAANRSLTAQFTQHTIRKRYLMLTDRPVRSNEWTVTSALVRAGEKYLSRPLHAGGEQATTRFRLLSAEKWFIHPRRALTRPHPTPLPSAGRGKPLDAADDAARAVYSGASENSPSPIGWERGGVRGILLEAEPLTGRTHQIRAHAASQGFPILGDVLYGGSPGPRVCLHAESLTLRHPGTGEEMAFRAPADFEAEARLALREAVIEPGQTNAYRLVHGASDGWPGWYVDRLGDFLLSQSESSLTAEQRGCLEGFVVPASAGEAHDESAGAKLGQLPNRLKAALRTGAYHKVLHRQAQRSNVVEASPQHLLGALAPERFTIRENGLAFELSFHEGASVGLFLDQRDNRRRFLTNHIAADFPMFPDGPRGKELLNTFAYTCAFSVCAAQAGLKTTSLDLSRNYLDWGRRNFVRNGLDPAAHDFIHGDVFNWLRRLPKKQRRFDVIVLDPPTFSQSKEHGVFRAEKDYGALVKAALPLLRGGGILFASTNAGRLAPEDFLRAVREAADAAGRRILQQHYVPQPADFPVSRAEPAHLKSVWLRLS